MAHANPSFRTKRGRMELAAALQWCCGDAKGGSGAVCFPRPVQACSLGAGNIFYASL